MESITIMRQLKGQEIKDQGLTIIVATKEVIR